MAQTRAARSPTPQQDLQTPEPAVQAAPPQLGDPMGMARAMGNEAMKGLLAGGSAPGQGDGGFASAGPPADGDGAAIAEVLAQTRGMPLPGDVLGLASQGLGRGMGDVRIHEGPEVDQLLGELGMRALTWGTAILRGRAGGAEEVLLHELVHIAQHDGRAPSGRANVSTGGAGGQAEAQADQGAAALQEGRTVSVQRQAPAARGFGATAPVRDGVRDRSAVCHENQTVDPAMQSGFSPEEARNIYSGNWQRDMNQLLLPMLQPANPAIYEILSIAHTRHFGTPLPGPGEMGTYDPVEHIDNPGGLVGSGVYDQNGDSASSTQTMGGEHDPLASLDPRYLEEAAAAQAESVPRRDGVRGDGSAPGEATEAAAFQVDPSGIPVYLRASRTQLVRSLVGAVGLSREEGGRSRALRMVGEALHIMQDYYAHSNFCEIAINILLRERGTTRYNEQGQVDASGRTLEEIFRASGHDLGRFNLDSLVHEITTDENGNRVVRQDQNLTHNDREVMATGTFMMADTIQSLKEKLLAAVEELNPFKETTPGPSEWTIAVFNWLQGNPTYVTGVDTGPIAARIRSVGPALRTVTEGAGVVLGGAGAVADAAASTAGEVGGTLVDYSPGGLLYEAVTGERAGDTVRDAGSSAGQAATAETTAIAEGLSSVNERLEQMAVDVETLSLAEVYRHAYESTSPWLRLSTYVREIPLVGEALADELKKAEDAVRDLARELLATLWDASLRQVIAEVDALVSAGVGSTEVTEDNGAQTMTQPTHTDIAKDFDHDDHGTHEVTSVIEEATEWVREVGNAGGQTLDELGDSASRIPEVGQPLGDMLHDAAESVSSENMDRALDDPHQHQHRHGGAWLAGLANTMAHASSRAILSTVHGLMDGPVAPDADVQQPIQDVVSTWMAHPEDCRGTWSGPFMATLQSQDASTQELQAELSRRTAQPPSVQAPNMHQTAHGAGSDHDHDHDHGGEHDHDHGGEHDHDHGGEHDHDHGGEHDHDHTGDHT